MPGENTSGTAREKKADIVCLGGREKRKMKHGNHNRRGAGERGEARVIEKRDKRKTAKEKRASRLVEGRARLRKGGRGKSEERRKFVRVF